MRSTHTITLYRFQVENALEAAEADLESIRPTYSGRNMYGETCLGVVFDSWSQLAQFLVELTGAFAEQTVDDEEPDVYEVIDPVRRMARSTHTDTMGHSVIAYWPGVQLEDEEPGNPSES